MSPNSSNQEAHNGSEEKQNSPDKIHLLVRSPHQSDRHPREDKQVIEIVADCFEPATEIGFQKLQPGNLSIAPAKQCRPLHGKPGSAEQHDPVHSGRWSWQALAQQSEGHIPIRSSEGNV